MTPHSTRIPKEFLVTAEHKAQGALAYTAMMAANAGVCGGDRGSPWTEEKRASTEPGLALESAFLDAQGRDPKPYVNPDGPDGSPDSHVNGQEVDVKLANKRYQLYAKKATVLANPERIFLWYWVWRGEAKLVGAARGATIRRLNITPKLPRRSKENLAIDWYFFGP